MRTWTPSVTAVAFGVLSAWLIVSAPHLANAQAPADAKAGTKAGKGKGKGGGFAQDPRAQTRTYHFDDTNEEVERFFKVWHLVLKEVADTAKEKAA